MATKKKLTPGTELVRYVCAWVTKGTSVNRYGHGVIAGTHRHVLYAQTIPELNDLTLS